MKVAYLLTWSGDQRTGVFKKVVDQVTAWGDLGVEAGLFVATSPESASDWSGVHQVAHLEIFSNGLKSFTVQRKLIDAVSAWTPDITYVRTTPRQAAAGKALHRLKHVIEIQTNDLAESKGLSPARYALTLATRRTCLRGARGLVFVSRELADLPSYSNFTPNRTVIGNGIDLTRFNTLPAPSNTEPRLAFMGLPGLPWHGLDDLARLAEQRPSWSFDLIGPRPGDLELPPNMTAHGELTALEYRPILGQADVAVSTLAWYRNNMNEASPLKSREYLALGLPVIGGYEDTDIPADSDIYLRLPNRPRAIIDELPRVDAFIAKWRGHRVARDQIEFLDTRVKESQRIEFLQGLL